MDLKLDLKLLLILFILPIGFTVNAQIFRGKVMDTYSNDGLSNALVQNLHTSDSVSSLSDGIFSINAQIGDTIQISLPHYLVQNIVADPTNLGNVVYFHLKHNELDSTDDVMIYAAEDTTSFWQRNYKVRRSMYIDTSQKPIKQPGMATGIVINGPITALSKVFSKNKKKKMNKQIVTNAAIQEMGTLQRTIDQVYTRELTMRLTHLSANQVVVFMNDYPMSYDMATSAPSLEIEAWIVNNYNQWKNKK